MSTDFKRYTLSLPTAIYRELSEIAAKEDRAIKDVVRQCLRFGLTAIKIEQDPNADIIFRERVYVEGENGQRMPKVTDTLVKFI